MPSSRNTMQLNKRDFEALIQFLKKLSSLAKDMERGIKACEVACNTVLFETDDMPVACPFMMDLCYECNPDQGKLAEELLAVISIENEFLNIIEDTQQLVEEATGIKAAATVSRRQLFKSRFQNQFFSEKEQNNDPLAALCFKEHFTRACEGSKLLFSIRRLFYKAEEDNDTLDQLHEEFKQLIPKFQDFTTTTDDALRALKC